MAYIAECATQLDGFNRFILDAR